MGEFQQPAKAARAPSGEKYIYTFSGAQIFHFAVEYDAELRRYRAISLSTSSDVRETFSLMRSLNQKYPGIFSGAKGIIRNGHIEAIGTSNNGQPFDPVTLAVEGRHQANFGNFMNRFSTCMSSSSCRESISPDLEDLFVVDDSWSINGVNLGLSYIFEAVANIGPPPTAPVVPNPSLELRLCLAGTGDCAIMKFSKSNGWEYVESRADSGNGARYPDPTQTVWSWNSNGGERISNGMRRAGYNVEGWLSQNFVFVCGYVNGMLDRCMYLPK